MLLESCTRRQRWHISARSCWSPGWPDCQVLQDLVGLRLTIYYRNSPIARRKVTSEKVLICAAIMSMYSLYRAVPLLASESSPLEARAAQSRSGRSYTTRGSTRFAPAAFCFCTSFAKVEMMGTLARTSLDWMHQKESVPNNEVVYLQPVEGANLCNVRGFGSESCGASCRQ
jgi:hypothetical protein